MNIISEILRTKIWEIDPDFAHGARQILESNFNGRTAFEAEDKTLQTAIPASAVGDGKTIDINDYLVTEDGEEYGTYMADRLKEDFVSVLMVEGPITRNGGACSFGSRDIRDLMMRAANSEHCLGHVFYIDTPGGSSWSYNDFKQAVDFAKSKNQPVLAFIDGTCASAGMHLISLCDERYYMNPKNTIGCIGTLAAFYTIKNGQQIYSGETYHEVYDPESFDKNKWARDIAEDDNDELLVDELKKDGEEFRAHIKEAFPKATEDHIHGKTFDAAEVEGIFLDGQRTFGDVIARVVELGSKARPQKQPQSTGQQSLSTKSAQSTKSTAAIEQSNNREVEQSNSREVEQSKPENQSSKNNIKMNEENVKIVAQACGVEDLVCSEEGTHLAPELIDNLAKALSEKNEMAKQNEELTAKVAELENEAKATAEQAAKDLEAARNETAEELTKAKEALKSAEQMVADRDEQIKALTAQPAEEHKDSPANNGDNPAGERQSAGTPQYDPALSPKENARILEEYRKSQRSHI